MVEKDPTVALAVETMDAQAYESYLAGRHAAVSSLSHSVEDYPGKKMLLEQAVRGEKDAADALRTLARVTVTAGAANEDLTIERRNMMMIQFRRNLFSARQLFLSVRSKSQHSLHVSGLIFVLCFSCCHFWLRCRLRGSRRSRS